jgi:tagatose 1,6-diphosphate aldolase
LLIWAEAMKISEGKAARLRRLATDKGVIAALAIDQRKSLRMMIAAAAGVETEAISDSQVLEFKSAVTRILSPHASAVLIDSEFGFGAFAERDPSCGLLTTYEMDGYENPRPHRMLALMPDLSVRRLRDMGSDGVKILLSYTPYDDSDWNDHKLAMIERIGAECEALEMPFFLEPVGYDVSGSDVKSFEYAKRKPEIVLRTIEELSKDVYKVDVLKVEFPVNAAYVDGSSVYAGQAAYTRDEALEWYRRVDTAAQRPYIYLSAGVSAPHFREQLRLSAEADSRFSGVLCGRATWQDGVPLYAKQGGEALERWLSEEGVANIRAVNDCLRSASPWYAWVE